MGLEKVGRPPILFLSLSLQGLGLLINMSEHSAQNRTQLQSTRIDDHSTESSQETASKEEEEDIRMMQDDVMGCHGNRSSMKALIRLFLKHHAKSEQVSIEVHCVCVCVCVCVCWGGGEDDGFVCRYHFTPSL